MAASKATMNAETGSPSSGEPVYLAVGFLRRPHGVRGEILLDVQTRFPDQFQPGIQLYLGKEYISLSMATCRKHAKGLLIAFEGITDRDEIARFRNHYVYVLESDWPSLPEGEYYDHQIIGLQVVVDETGETLGELKDIIETGANDVYVVISESGREILLPAIPEVILDVDLDHRQMRVYLLPGLIDEEK